MKFYFTKHLQMESCSSYQRSTVIKDFLFLMKICNIYVWVILSKPGSNNLYLKVPPSIGIGQQCINAFGYHGNGVATTYFRMATIHCIILCSCVYYCLTHPQPQNSCLCIEIGACTHNGWKWTNNSDWLNKCKQTLWQC